MPSKNTELLAEPIQISKLTVFYIISKQKINKSIFVYKLLKILEIC